MNFKRIIKQAVLRLFPELAAGTHLPKLAIVTRIPDPPAGGQAHTHTRPYYAVSCRLLLPNGETIDPDMPELADVPVALPGAGTGRGFASLPQPGTIVELAYAYGKQTQPFIRCILPYRLALPAIDAQTQRWQQTAAAFQEVSAAGQWTRKTPADIIDQAANIRSTATVDIIDQARNIKQLASDENEFKAPLTWIGSDQVNALRNTIDFQQSVIDALTTLATHTHGGAVPVETATIAAKAAEVTAEKTELTGITK